MKITRSFVVLFIGTIFSPNAWAQGQGQGAASAEWKERF